MQYIHVMDTTMMAIAFVWNSPVTAFQGLHGVGLAGAEEGAPRLGAHSTEWLLQVCSGVGISVYTYVYLSPTRKYPW